MNHIKYILGIILIGLASFIADAQTITKTASKSSAYIGEKFTYTIAIENITNFGTLDKIEDIFGPEVTITNVTQSNSMRLLDNWGFCSSISHTTTNLGPGLGTKLEVSFNNCSGSTNMFNRISVDVEVELNDEACALNKTTNVADLLLKNPTSVISSTPVDVTIDHSNPFELQKTFFKYDALGAGGILYYDIRLSSKSGNFKVIDFSTEKFIDQFTVPSCFGSMSPSDIEVVYIPDESNRSIEVVVPQSNRIVGSNLEVEWSFSNSVNSNESSLLFVVKINIDECNCSNQLFDLINHVGFDFDTVCGNSFNMGDKFRIDGVTCDIEKSIPSECELNFTKRYELEGNDLGLTMKGCKGKYIIDIENCSTNLEFTKIRITDFVPSELDILNVNVNGWSLTQTGQQLYISGGGLSPGGSHQIVIEFIVNTNIPNHVIENCANIELQAKNIYTGVPKIIIKQSCTRFITVPNEVAVVKRKSICSKVNHQCGLLSTSHYLPDDEVEYELFFYNYGNADGANIIIEDVLPDYLRIINLATDVKVYKVSEGLSAYKEKCKLTGYGSGQPNYQDITNSVNIQYPGSGTLNTLKINMGNNIMDAFTCKGVTFYKATIKGKILQNAQSGTYENQFVLSYKDTSIPAQKSDISNKVSYTVNINDLILGWKRASAPVQDCENNTSTVTYSIAVANMGNRAVNVDLIDQINVPGLVDITSGPQNFKRCDMTGTAGTLCTPVSINPATSFANYNQTSNGFSIVREPLQPCTMLYFTYEVVYNTDLLSGTETADVCNELEVWAYTGRRRITPLMFKKSPQKFDNVLVSLNPQLNDMYMEAKTPEEQLRITEVMKLLKADPKLISNPNNLGFLNTNVLDDLRFPRYNPFSGVFFGIDRWNECVTVKDCLGGKDKGCVNTNGTNNLNFKINSIDAITGEITTTLTSDPTKKISSIEYVFTDVEYSRFCNSHTVYIGSRPYLSCRECDGDVTGHFRPTNTNVLTGGLSYLSNPFNNYNLSNGSYKEWNTVYYEGPPTSLSSVNNEFYFPKTENCSGNFSFTITAIVTYEDCSTCYASDAIDYRSYYDWRRPIPWDKDKFKPYDDSLELAYPF